MSATAALQEADPKEEKNFKQGVISDQPETSRPIPDEKGTAVGKAEAVKIATAADASLNLPGTSRNSWEAFVDHRHAPTDLLHPLYWGQYHDQLMAGDYIDAEANDCAWSVRLRVMEVDPVAQMVVVAPMGDINVFDRPPVPDGFVIEFVTRAAGFRVVRAGVGGKLMKGGFKSFHGAHSWLTGQR